MRRQGAHHTAPPTWLPVGDTVMEHTKVCRRFKFEKKGITKNASFSGPVVLLGDGLFLVAKSVTTGSEVMTTALFGLLGALIASLSSSVAKMEFPYPAATCDELPDELRSLKAFGKLKEKHRIVVVQREDILGFTSSFLGGFKLVCAGEDIVLMGSKKKLKSSFLEHGYAEYEPES